MTDEQKGFKKELEELLNKYSKENESDTPDFILAGFITACLTAFNGSTLLRDTFHGFNQKEKGQ